MLWILFLLSFQQPVQAHVQGHHVSMAWKASSTAGSEYFVYRRAGSQAFVKLTSTPIAVVTYTDTTVQAHQTYSYYVTAEVNGVESVPSNTVVARIK